jgi:hypothetical protein
MDNITYVILACYADKGMKSLGSKGLMVFQNKKLLEHQISWIKKATKFKHEIIIVCDFDYQKIHKSFHKDAIVIETKEFNPIYTACVSSKNSIICFIDYGCMFKSDILKKLEGTKTSKIVTMKSNNDLDVGCICDDDKVEHMFLDLPEDKFCNIFYLKEKEVDTIKNNSFFKRKNLLYFEIINKLIEYDFVFNKKQVSLKDFIYFNNTRQKNGISKFIKKNPN